MLNETHSSACTIAVMHQEAGFFVGYLKTLYRFSGKGKLVETIDLEEVCDTLPRGGDLPGHESMPREQLCWRCEVGADDEAVYFTWVTKGTDGAHVGRLDLSSQDVEWLPVNWGHGNCFDTRRGIRL